MPFDLRTSIQTAWIVVLLIVETIWPFREDYQESRIRHLGRNAAMTLFNFLFNAVFLVSLIGVTSIVFTQQIGLFHWVEIPVLWQYVIAFLLYDFILYWWHWANHNIRFFWAFHQVHHTDHILDFSTATRFHVLELGYFLLIRLVFAILIGASLPQMLFLETVIIVFAQWEHANLKLPDWLDHRLQMILVTPAMHRLHHSDIKKERNSNYTTTLSIWDKLFGTYHAPIANENRLIIGLKKFPNKAKLRIQHLIAMPITDYPEEKS